MTTSPVMTLTEELLAELEEAFMLGWNESGEGWNAEYPQTDEAAEMVMLAAKRRAMDLALIARVRELEKDASRLDWITERLEDMEIGKADPCRHATDDEESWPVLWRRAIDYAMQEAPK